MRIIRKTPLAKNRKLGISAFVLPVLLATVFLLPGCNMFNKPLSDFLEYWTDVAQINRHSFDGSYPETGGLTNLPSGADRVITCYVINPQNYDLGIEVTFDPNLPGWDPIRMSNNPNISTTSNQGTVEQDPIDKSIIRLTLNENALASLDGTGSTLNPTISIVEPNSGRDFGSYTIPLRVNSAPNKAKNAVIMTWNDNSTAKYAVLFYLPEDKNNQYSPDRDVVSMTVSGFSGKYNTTFAIPASGDIGGVENTYAQGDFSPVTSGDSFIPLNGYRFVGIKTGLIVGSVVPSCTVTLRDSSGLESTTDVSTTSAILTEIYVDPDKGNDSYPGSDILPVKTIGRAMEKLSGMTGTTIILEGDITVPDTLSFTASHPNITLKGGATPVTLTYSGTGRAITVSGGKLTLGENITITGADDGAVEITGGEFVMETDSTLKGNGSSTIFGGGVYVNGGKFTMTGGTIGGSGGNYANTAWYGGGVYVQGGTFTMEDGTISGNNATGDSGGVGVDSNGEFTMSGGTISGNNADRGGGVCLHGGIFNMSDTAAIKGNTADSGGGVYVNGGTFEMTGGTIGGTGADANSANNSGGGVYVENGTFTISGGKIIGQVNKNEIYSAKTFAITKSPAITDCTITLEQNAHIDVQGLSTDAALSNVQVSLPIGDYVENAVLLENAGSKGICGKFALDNPPSNGVWWIGLADNKQDGILRYINGTLSSDGSTVTVTTPPTDNAGLQDLVNDSADGGYKVEITGGGSINIDSTVSVPGGADVAIKPASGSSVDITASGKTTVFDVQAGGTLTLGGDDGVVAIIGDPSEQYPVYNDDSPLIKVSGGGTVDIGKNTEIKDNNAGRGVTVSDGGILNMTGGTISGNSGYNGGGGVLIYGKNSNFTMSGGEICNNKLVKNSPNSDPRQGGGVCVFGGAVFTLSGNAEIYKNSAQDGGAVCVKDGFSEDKKSTFNMYGGTIRDNSSSGVGAVYIRAATAIMYMKGGKITNNITTSSTYAGGIYIDGGTFDGTGAQDASVTDNTIGDGTEKNISKRDNSTSIYEQGSVVVGP